MAEINNNAGLNSLLAQYGTDRAKAKAGVDDTQASTAKASIGEQDVFMKLYIEQLKNQDPTAPQDTNDMVAQMSQFNQVEQLTTISARLETMASALTSSQALGASTLVGKSVFVNQTAAELVEGQSLSMRSAIPDDAVSSSLSIYNSKNELVKTMDLTQNEYSWDGKDESGNLLPPGQYSFSATSKTLDGSTVQLNTLLPARIQGVTINGVNGTELNVAGYGKLSLTRELEIVG